MSQVQQLLQVPHCLDLRRSLALPLGQVESSGSLVAERHEARTAHRAGYEPAECDKSRNSDMSCSKLPYRTQWMALRAMRAIGRKSKWPGAVVPIGAHFCSECRCWHLTSRSRTQTPPWEKRRPTR